MPKIKNFPPNLLLNLVLPVLPPKNELTYYNDPVLSPEKLQDIHIVISLITNTIWNNLKRVSLQECDEVFISRIKKIHDNNPQKLAYTLYKSYVFSFLYHKYDKNEKTAEKRLPRLLKKYPLQYFNFEWKLMEEIIDYFKDYNPDNPKKSPFPPKTFAFMCILENFLTLLESAGIFSWSWYGDVNRLLYIYLRELKECFRDAWNKRYRFFK